MIITSTNAAQTLTTGQAVTFSVLRQTGCSEYFQENSSDIYLKTGGLYLVDVSGNITASAAATPVQLQISFNGSSMADGLMNAVPAAAGDLVNVSRSTAVSTSASCCFKLGTATISVVNTGANPVTIAPGFSVRIGRVG